VVRTSERRLYLVLGDGRALRYSVGVGRSGKQWFGSTFIVNKQIRPAWSPPAEIRRGRPAWVIPAGARNNPMGAAALVLADNELAIHGTNNPGSIGGLVSWGCIRMHNRDIMELYNRVGVGTRVVLTR
jgi:lipoprotein-anchoring transpeptidase ErfK/SrfK